MAARGADCSFYFLVAKLLFLLLVIAPVLISGVCRFGSGCIFPCHCQNDENCNETTGFCENGCQKYVDSGSGKAPFSGPGCQIGNLARGRGDYASQVGTTNKMYANKAVDGDIRQVEAYCAHPLAPNGSVEAWWQVDLGDVYFINSVIIVNGYQGDSNNFLHDIDIKIGNSSNVMGHRRCGGQSDVVPPMTNVTIPCEDWGSHVSIRKSGGHRKDALLFCEVFVIGYKYIDCRDACDGTCDKVIGCDKCQAGRKMSDCKLECDAGTCGVNCANECGHCVRPDQCDRMTCSCHGGCQQWYGLDTCTAEINKVDYQGTPTWLSVTISSVSVSWPQSEDVPRGLESHYQYVVEAADGHSISKVTRPFVAGQASQTADIKGLKHNSKYYVKVRIDASHKSKTKMGTPGPSLEVTTACTSPAKPKKPSVTPTDPEDSHLGSLHVTWQGLEDSGCDNFKKLLVLYKLTSSGQWQNKEVGVKKTQVTLDNLQSGHYSVRLSVTNNEDIESVSDTIRSPVGGAAAKSADPKKGDGSTGIIIGVVVTLVVLIILVIIVVIFRLRNGNEVCKGMTRRDSQPSQVHVEVPPDRNAPADVVEQGEEQEVEQVAPVVQIPEEGIYQNLMHASTLVTVDKLEAYIKERDTITDGFVPEYNNLARTDSKNVKAATRPMNVPLNRFKNIWPYDHSRVKLKVDEDNPSDYINACYITGYKDKAQTYIACQGPRQNTLSDMWRMIWQLKINRIVMVTQLSENGKRKCDIYWPLTVGTQKVYGQVTVATLSCDVYADFTIRTFELTCQGGSHKVTHFQYTSWIDKGVPKDTYLLLALRRLIRSHDSSGPMVVHCSAGIGRTGTFIALDSLLEQAKAEGQVDVYRFVNHMRTERMEMIQTQIQYVFLYHALLDGIKTGPFACPVSQFHASYKRLCEDDKSLTELQEQFQMLENLKPKPPGPSSAALLKTNKNKNRSLEIIPDDNNRPYLTSRSPGTNDYINAVYLDSHRKRNSFLLTEIPQPNTVVDLWRLVLDHQCPTIIMLEEDKEGEVYWPDEEDPKMTHGTLTVELLNERYTTIQNVVERELNVYLTASPKHNHKVKQYQLSSGWPRGTDIPRDSTTFLNLVELANRPVNEDGSGPTILQCMNGASRCGLFCVATQLLGSLSIDQYVDVFHSTQHVRSKRPQAIESLEQYKFLHKLVVDYQGQHATYLNV